MVAAGVVPDEIPEKPDALLLFEQTQTLNIPVRAGGLLDQPFILLQEFGIVAHHIKQHEAFENAQRNSTYERVSAQKK